MKKSIKTAAAVMLASVLVFTVSGNIKNADTNLQDSYTDNCVTISDTDIIDNDIIDTRACLKTKSCTKSTLMI